MAEPDYRRKQHSDAQPIVYVAMYTAGTPNFTGATLNVRMRRPNEATYKIDAPGTIDTDTNEFSFAPAPVDVNESGWFYLEWTVTYSDGTTERWPTRGYLTVFFERAL
jgi:hypothetical protein